MIPAIILAIPLWVIALALRDLHKQIKQIEQQDESNTNV